ncbi:MAG: hypothetical protein FWD88_00410 [Treponema sp.]|nr:hypothetical protein [Treponema sp.]
MEEAERAGLEAGEKTWVKAEREKARRKLQRWVKWPVFIPVAFLSFSVWAIQVDEEASGTRFNVSLGVFALLLALYCKMLTGSLDWVHGQLQEDDLRNATKANRLAAYGIAALLPTLVFAGLYLLVFHALPERLY